MENWQTMLRKTPQKMLSALPALSHRSKSGTGSSFPIITGTIRLAERKELCVYSQEQTKTRTQHLLFRTLFIRHSYTYEGTVYRYLAEGGEHIVKFLLIDEPVPEKKKIIINNYR